MAYGKIIYEILSLFYPNVCPGCGNILLRSEDTVCLGCQALLPRTGYESDANNPLARMFYGRIPFKAVASIFFFAKQGKVQHIIHSLKYHHNAEAGIFLGREMGKVLKDAPLFHDADYLIPIPLHPKRQRSRGYNQSEMIARGIAEVTGIEVSTRHLLRSVNTATQTKKTRQERWDNVKDIFTLSHDEELTDKYVIIIDDVLTTGATLESCGKILETVPGISISALTAACAGG